MRKPADLWRVSLAACALLLAPGCAPPRPAADPAQAEARVALHEYVINFWVKRDTSALARALSPSMTYHYNGRVIPGDPEAHFSSLTYFGDAFPDLAASVDVFTFADSLGAAVTTWTGTHSGVLCQTPGSGLELSWVVNYIFRVADGRIVELWEAWDEGAIYRALGIDAGKCPAP